MTALPCATTAAGDVGMPPTGQPVDSVLTTLPNGDLWPAPPAADAAPADTTTGSPGTDPDGRTQLTSALHPEGPEAPLQAVRLSYVEGDVGLRPAGSEAWLTAELNWPLTGGDAVWTALGAPAELISRRWRCG